MQLFLISIACMWMRWVIVTSRVVGLLGGESEPCGVVVLVAQSGGSWGNVGCGEALSGLFEWSRSAPVSWQIAQTLLRYSEWFWKICSK